MNFQSLYRSLIFCGVLWMCGGVWGSAVAGEPKQGGTLRMADTTGILNFDGHKLPEGNYPMLPQVYNTLMRLEEGTRQAELAESWSFSKDGLTLELKLREGVKFHNGRELVSDDVVWNIRRVQDPKTAATAMPLSRTIKSAEVGDKYRVIVRLEKPTPAVLDLFDIMWIIPKEAEADIQKMGIGTGPFQVVQWVPGDRVIFKKFPDYFRKGLPYLDGVILQRMPDSPAMIVNLEAGALDLAYRIPPRDAARLMKDRKDILVKSTPVANVEEIIINVSKAPFDNKKVRQAINHAVDRKRFVDTVLVGFGEPMCQALPPQSAGFSRDLGNQHCAFDLAQAKQLLAEAGYPDGFASELHISTATYPESRQLAQILQADLAKIGVRLTIRDLEPADFRETYFGGAKGKFAMVIHQYSRTNRDPDTLYRTTVAWNPRGGLSTFGLPEYASLVDDAGSTMDPAKRRQLYDQIAHYVADQAFVLPITPIVMLMAIGPTVQGVENNVDGMPILEKAWLTR